MYGLPWHINRRSPPPSGMSDWPTWLGEVEDDPATLLGMAGDDVLRVWAVSRGMMGWSYSRRLGDDALAPLVSVSGSSP